MIPEHNMKFADIFLGHWAGEVADSEREHLYRGTIVIDPEHMRTTYYMARGTKSGLLTSVLVSDNIISCNETVGSWKGKLTLQVDGNDKLVCTWRSVHGDSTASMTRVDG